MNRVIIVEGPQGVGKTTLTNWLREQMLSTVLIRLTGVGDKSKLGEWKSFQYHYSILRAISDSFQCSVDFVLDRSFITEQVYTQLGYKPYRFDNRFKVLSKFLERSVANNYEVFIFNLSVSVGSDIADRLHRSKPAYHEFSLQSSIEQQVMYEGVIGAMSKSFCPHVKVYNIDTSRHDYRSTIAGILGLTDNDYAPNIKPEIK